MPSPVSTLWVEALASAGRALGGVHDPAHRLGAGARAAEAREPWHRVDRGLELHLAARDLALELHPMLHVDRRAIRLGQMREHVRDVRLDLRELLAVETGHLERGLAAATEEAAVGKPQQRV